MFISVLLKIHTQSFQLLSGAHIYFQLIAPNPPRDFSGAEANEKHEAPANDANRKI